MGDIPAHGSLQAAAAAAWTTISIGMGSRVMENTMEVSHLMLVGGGGE